jgi:hypothetical protein
VLTCIHALITCTYIKERNTVIAFNNHLISETPFALEEWCTFGDLAQRLVCVPDQIIHPCTSLSSKDGWHYVNPYASVFVRHHCRSQAPCRVHRRPWYWPVEQTWDDLDS